jgi:methylated-DNA-protein-cysteine methyltransferase-like protein
VPTRDTERDDFTEFERAVAVVLDAIAEGDIMTYGEVAAEAGYPGAARAVGSFMRSKQGFAWWRIVAANGRLVPGLEAEHTRRLRAEGVTVENGRIPMR